MDLREIAREMKSAQDAARQIEPEVRHRALEQIAVLGLLDRRHARADELVAALLQHSVRGEIEGQIEAGLAAHGRQQGVGTLGLEGGRRSEAARYGKRAGVPGAGAADVVGCVADHDGRRRTEIASLERGCAAAGDSDQVIPVLRVASIPAETKEGEDPIS